MLATKYPDWSNELVNFIKNTAIDKVIDKMKDIVQKIE